MIFYIFRPSLFVVAYLVGVVLSSKSGKMANKNIKVVIAESPPFLQEKNCPFDTNATIHVQGCPKKRQLGCVNLPLAQGRVHAT